jgi:hypothetical protein
MIKYTGIMRLALFVLFIGVLTSCGDDFLNPKPTTALEDDEVFTSLTNAKAAMIGAYDQLSSYSFDGLYLPIMSDLTGEDVMLNSEKNYNWFVSVYQLNVLPNYQYASRPWSAGYKIIYDANKIIVGAQQLPDATEEEINALVAEAKVMRAYAMLKMVEVFAPAYASDPDAPGILLITKPLQYDAPDVGRSSVRDVYEQIIADLTYAANTLDTGNEPGFFGKKAAQAVLARAYLDMQEWENARDWAKLAYEGMELMNLGEMLNGFYSSNSETIFSLAYTPEDNNVYLSIPSFYWPVYGYSSMRANDKFVEKFDSNDFRSRFFSKIDWIDADNWLIFKFQHNQSVGNAERIAIRAAEMYLIEAECEAELGNWKKAQDALYVIQNRAHPGIEKSTNTGQELIDEILLERRKELFGEGFRWNDIKRRNLPFMREGDHWVKLDFGPGDEDYYRLTFPIPQRELDANNALDEGDQNNGY